MKITFNPSTVAALTTPPNNKDITFDLRGRNIFARGVKFYGTDTNTWRDIKINNVSIGSYTLDLRNGSNTTLTNTNGVVTINSTWRPVVDNLTSDSTTSSLSANQGRVLKALIDGKSNSDHNHDGRYVRYYAVTTLDCNNLAAGLTAARISATNAAHTNHSAYLYISDVGTPFQIQIPDSSIPYIYKRYYGSGRWSEWFKLNAGYADSAGNAQTLGGMPKNYGQAPFGTIPYIGNDGIMEVGKYIDFHNDNNGKHDFSTRLQSTGNYGNEVNLPSARGTLALTSDILNYYWANVKISASANTQTQPSVNTIYANNWFRSQGTSGWYSESYGGGIWMKDSSWIRTYGGKSFYCDNQIYSSSSIRMGDILLQYSDEINNIAGGLLNLNFRHPGNVSLCVGGGKVGIGTMSPIQKLDVNGGVKSHGFMHTGHNNNDAVLLAGGDYKTLNSIWGGDSTHFVFLGYLTLRNGADGTIRDSFMCLGKSVPFTYTRGGAYCLINIPDTSSQTFYIKAAIASVHYSGQGMGHWVGNHRGDGAWWLHCDAVGSNAVQVKGFHLANGNNDSWWGGNPLYSSNGAAKMITVCLFGYVLFK